MRNIKRLICLFLLCGLLCSCALHSNDSLYGTGEYPPFDSNPRFDNGQTKRQDRKPLNEELRAVWIYFSELNCKGLDESKFREKINQMFDDVVSFNLNAVIVHVRPFCDAFYTSDFFPFSIYLTGTQGGDPGYDPLEYMVAAAHERGLQFHAWINPFRVSASSEDPMTLSQDNPARIYLTDADEENDDWAVQAEGGIYLNPVIPEVQRLITNGICEIVERYAVDGIHFDDYFYPTQDPSFDGEAYHRYQEERGEASLPQEDWRRERMNTFVSTVYSAIKALDDRVVFGISPQADLDTNFNNLYADVAHWMESPGYVDYIMPQVYFGFKYTIPAFQYPTIVETWYALPRTDGVKLYYGLPAYKIGEEDNGSDEWLEDEDILRRQVEFLREREECEGFALYSYTPLFSDEALHKAQRENLAEVLG